MPKVTVAIITYNREKYLGDCIKSILDQTFQDFEIIIFDNHSDYDVKKFVEQFNDSRIKVIINDTNIGGIGNMDQIFKYNFSSTYFVLFHDDDAMHPDFLLKEVSLMDKNPEMVFVVTDLNNVENHDLILVFPRVKSRSKELVFSNYADLVRLLLRHFGFCFDSVMYRSNSFNDFFDYYEKYSDWCDRPFCINIAKQGTTGVIKEKLINYRVHKGQGSQANHVGKFVYFMKVYNYYKGCLPQPLSASDEKLFYRWSTNNLILLCSSFSANFKEYFKVLKQSQENDLFKPKYLNVRGLYYALIVIKRMIKRELKRN